jgi:hypothetical protein
MAKAGEHSGGCLCGAVRYVAVGAIDAGYCHCRMCQRSSGAPVLAWASFPSGSFSYESGEVACHRSSSHGAREFCRDCGTQLLFRDSRTPERLDINLGSLDDPTALPPQYHTWTTSRIAWFDTADELPRFEDDGPDAVKP